MSRILLALVCLAAAVPATAAEVHGVRLWAGPDHTRVVLDVSGPVEHTLFTLADPGRVVIDIPNAAILDSAILPDADGLVGSIRTGAREDADLRVVLDLASDAHPRSFLTPPNGTYGYRLVIDLEPAVAASRAVISVADNEVAGGRDIVVAVDAGHGGEDPGATGRGGLHEKVAVLAIARRLAAEIDAVPGMRAMLTRDGDYFVSLQGRREKAREAGADLFVSIHADSFTDARAYGASIYVLSQRGATSERARFLAQRENESDLIGGVSLSDKDDVLASVLLDLSQTASISASLDVGERVLAGMGTVQRLHKREVQQAGFAVLKSPDMPSILVETAFISNPQEERQLGDAAHQRRLARSIAAGLRDYFWSNPPQGTRIAALRAEGGNSTVYTVTSGDTLSAIAQRHRIDVDTLRAVNGISGDAIRIGQIIAIPNGP